MKIFNTVTYIFILKLIFYSISVCDQCKLDKEPCRCTSADTIKVSCPMRINEANLTLDLTTFSLVSFNLTKEINLSLEINFKTYSRIH